MCFRAGCCVTSQTPGGQAATLQHGYLAVAHATAVNADTKLLLTTHRNGAGQTGRHAHWYPCYISCTHARNPKQQQNPTHPGLSAASYLTNSLYAQSYVLRLKGWAASGQESACVTHCCVRHDSGCGGGCRCCCCCAGVACDCLQLGKQTTPSLDSFGGHGRLQQHSMAPCTQIAGMQVPGFVRPYCMGAVTSTSDRMAELWLPASMSQGQHTRVCCQELPLHDGMMA